MKCNCSLDAQFCSELFLALQRLTTLHISKSNLNRPQSNHISSAPFIGLNFMGGKLAESETRPRNNTSQAHRTRELHFHFSNIAVSCQLFSFFTRSPLSSQVRVLISLPVNRFTGKKLLPACPGKKNLYR